MPILASEFRPHPLLANRHLQTLWYQLVPPWPRAERRPGMDRERFELPDGDFLDLYWTRTPGPILLFLHGLGGSLRSGYARRMIRAFAAAGFCVLFMHFRGCSGEPNRLPRGYHSGDTGDLALVVDHIAERFPGTPLTAFGVSLGGNVLLKYLGERGGRTPLAAAAAASVPFVLADAAQTLTQGFARVYQAYLLRSLVTGLRRKAKRVAMPFPLPDLNALASIAEFDDQITAPLHGFAGAEDYYRRSSSRGFLSAIEVPTLVLHAADDPFMTPAAIPGADELAPCLELELAQRGGHLGFVAAGPALMPRYWMEERIPAWLCAKLVAGANREWTGRRAGPDAGGSGPPVGGDPAPRPEGPSAGRHC